MKYEGHKLRHELKYYIDYNTYHTLRERFRNVLFLDENMPDEDGYLISSIYFDDMYHSAVREKIAGSRFRKKFRIRSYEGSDSLIRLECKYKFDEYIAKESAKLTPQEYRQVMDGDYDFLLQRPEQVCQELFCYNRTKLLKPVVVVEYRREAYVYPLGNIRITFDKNISASAGVVDMFSPEYSTNKVLPENVMVLEVKYDDYIPVHIMQLLRGATSDRCAISKYVMCRDKKRLVSAR